MARRRILASGMAQQIISAAGMKRYRVDYRWIDAVASVGFPCCGIQSTRAGTVLLL